jgi:hypothetical protein
MAAGKIDITKSGVQYTSEPPDAKVTRAAVWHACSEKASFAPDVADQNLGITADSSRLPWLRATRHIEVMTPFKSEIANLPMFQRASKTDPEHCLTYRFVVTRMNFISVEEELDGRDPNLMKRHWVLKPAAPSATQAAVAAVSLTVTVNGKTLVFTGNADRDHYRYREIQMAVLDLLAQLEQGHVVSNYQFIASDAVPPPGMIPLALTFSEKEDLHNGKGFAKGFATGFLTLGAVSTNSKDYDYASEVGVSVELGGVKYGPYQATSSAKRTATIDMSSPGFQPEYARAAAAARLEVTMALLKEVLSKIEQARVASRPQ